MSEAHAHAQSLSASHTERLAQLIEQFPRCALYINELGALLKDKPFSTELIEYLIKEFISTNDPCAEEIIRTVNQLKDTDSRETVHAIKKFSRAIYNNKVNVFISYKQKDEAVATVVAKALRGVSSKLDITYAGECSSSKDYREKSLRATRNAHWFILLLPDPAEDWDWCLYESGLFRAKKLPGDRLICIHHEGSSVPDQIGNIDAVPAVRDHLIPFLHKLICEPDPLPGMDTINEGAMVAPIADIIASQISPSPTVSASTLSHLYPDNIPQRITILATAMNVALRFRWEVVENDHFHTNTMNHETAMELRTTINSVMRDKNSIARLNLSQLKAQFDDDASKSTLDSIWRQWEQLTNKNEDGALDIALIECNGERINQLLLSFLPINRHFLKLISQRLSDTLT